MKDSFHTSANITIFGQFVVSWKYSGPDSWYLHFTAGRCGRAAITQEEVRRKCIERNYPAPTSHPLGICFRFGGWRWWWWLVWWCKKRFDSAPTEFSFRSLLIFGGSLRTEPQIIIAANLKTNAAYLSRPSVVKCVMSRINSCSGWTRIPPLNLRRKR